MAAATVVESPLPFLVEVVEVMAKRRFMATVPVVGQAVAAKPRQPTSTADIRSGREDSREWASWP